MSDNKPQIRIEIKEGIGKESKKPWKAIKLEIGDISQLIFPKTRFEMDFIESNIEKAEVTIVDGVGKESKKPWRGVKLQIGEWSQLIFPHSKVEMEYMQRIIEDK